MDYLTSLHGIEERLKGGKKALALFYVKENDRVRPLLALANKRAIPVKQVSKDELKKMGAFQAALAIPVAELGGQKWFDKKMEALAGKDKALVVVLDGVTDPHNLGAILRSACLFGVDLVIYGERRSAQGDTDTVMRTSAGASELVAHGAVPNINAALKAFKEAGFWLYGTTKDGEPINKVKVTAKAALVMGSEGKGLAQLVRKNCDHLISIPTNNRLDSLNVAVAAGICLYQLQS
ncbi:MAG: 23S rRNA (guanosine(2251)-2'-O)-methyltransferase RlmB [Spirochaetaceae bacterium]|nr:23S rRNA (guanosine(2251)-2'-O)-methyltransferase RlmB [Spirochaetaceae bacterium]